MDDELAKGFAAQNQLYATVAGMLKSQPEAVDDVKKLQAPTYQADLTAIQRSFMSAVQAVKKEVGNDLSANRGLTSQAVKKIYAELTKGQKKLNRKITAEQIGEAVAQSVSHLPGIDTEAVKQMFLAMTGTLQNHEKRPDNQQLCALAKRGDADAQNLLIENNLRFIKKTACEVWSAQAELNRSLQMSLDDLAQEGSLGLYGCIDSYNADSGNLFLTYAASAIRNAMIDYIRSQNVSFEAKNLNNIISLDELAKDEVRSMHNFIADPIRQTPEQIYLAQEHHDDIHRTLEMIEAREERYLRYRFGFEDDTEHPLTETAKRFHLSESRAKRTEAQALDNVWLELPWWY